MLTFEGPKCSGFFFIYSMVCQVLRVVHNNYLPQLNPPSWQNMRHSPASFIGSTFHECYKGRLWLFDGPGGPWAPDGGREGGWVVHCPSGRRVPGRRVGAPPAPPPRVRTTVRPSRTLVADFLLSYVQAGAHMVTPLSGLALSKDPVGSPGLQSVRQILPPPAH